MSTEMSINILGVDVVDAAEVLDLLNLEPHDMDNPKKFNKIKSVLEYFKGEKNLRQKLLTLLSGKQGDKLDIVWTYTELQREKTRTIQKFIEDDSNVPEDIIKSGVGHKDRKKTRKQMEERIREIKTKQRDERIYGKQKDAALGEALRGLQTKKDYLDKVDFIDEELSVYG